MRKLPTDRPPTHPGEMLLEEFLRPPPRCWAPGGPHQYDVRVPGNPYAGVPPSCPTSASAGTEPFRTSKKHSSRPVSVSRALDRRDTPRATHTNRPAWCPLSPCRSEGSGCSPQLQASPCAELIPSPRATTPLTWKRKTRSGDVAPYADEYFPDRRAAGAVNLESGGPAATPPRSARAAAAAHPAPSSDAADSPAPTDRPGDHWARRRPPRGSRGRGRR